MICVLLYQEFIYTYYYYYSISFYNRMSLTLHTTHGNIKM